MPTQRRTLEKPQGYGELRMAGARPVKVRYSLVVRQAVDDDAPTGPLAGQVEIRGTIEVSDHQGMIDLSGKTFTLITDDSRCLEAMAKKGDPVTRQWEIAATGHKGLERC